MPSFKVMISPLFSPFPSFFYLPSADSMESSSPSSSCAANSPEGNIGAFLVVRSNLGAVNNEISRIYTLPYNQGMMIW